MDELELRVSAIEAAMTEILALIDPAALADGARSLRERGAASDCRDTMVINAAAAELLDDARRAGRLGFAAWSNIETADPLLSEYEFCSLAHFKDSPMRRPTVFERVRALRIQRRRERRARLSRGRVAQSISGRRRAPWRALVDPSLFAKSTTGVSGLPLVASKFTSVSGRVYRCWRLSAPNDFRHEENPDGVWEFIYELRRQVFLCDRFRGVGRKRQPNLYIDLDHITLLDLEGALILAAELDRVRHVLGFRAVLDDGRWDPWVRALLHGLGLYRVMEAGRQDSSVEIDDAAGVLASRGVAIVPFVSCHKADPVKAMELRDALVGHCRPSDEAQLGIYDSLVEAFTNAVQHAYREGVEGDGIPSAERWWAVGLVDKQDGYLHLVVFDQGVGIPATLVRRDWWALIKGQLPETSDAAVIAGGLEYGRTGSGDEAGGRGNGLWRMCELTHEFEHADVRFTSLQGQVEYARGRPLERTTLKTRFGGTMVRWRAKIDIARAQAS